MSAVLGVSCHYHEAAAALVVDGEIRAAIAEERLSRVKHDPSLPRRAIRAVLDLGGVTGPELDAVVYHEDPYAKIERILVYGLGAFPHSIRQLPRALASQLSGKLWVLDALAREVGVPRARVLHRTHHESHAASAFFTSPFDEACVLTVDGVGESTTTALWHGRGDTLTRVESLELPHSLGLLYAAITAWCGFEVNGGEYKVMGLAAFGEPRFREAFERLITLHPDGSFSLDARPFGRFLHPTRGYGRGLEDLLGPARAPRRPWDLDRDDDRRRADVAATLQQVVEEALLGLCRRARDQVGAPDLCLAGGVALNCVANDRIQRESGFDRVFVHPAAGDAGGALGAAILGAVDLGDPRPGGFTPFLGVAPDAGRAADVARHLGLSVREVSDADAAIVERLGRGQVIARCSGRSEWGPRALGNRSLLADPRDSETRERINRDVKGREAFRPFAPAVPAGLLPDLVDGEADLLTAHMTTVRRVRPGAPLAAATHVDGTARIQSVQPVDPLGGIVGAFGPVLNTSLNAAGDAMVGRETDALSFLLRHPVDALYVQDVEITR